jgi:hypothetical protein
MPSVHVGWALLIALTVICVSRSRWRWLILVYPALTTLAVVVTANHFWLDGVAAAALLALALLAQRAGRVSLRALVGAGRIPGWAARSAVLRPAVEAALPALDRSPAVGPPAPAAPAAPITPARPAAPASPAVPTSPAVPATKATPATPASSATPGAPTAPATAAAPHPGASSGLNGQRADGHGINGRQVNGRQVNGRQVNGRPPLRPAQQGATTGARPDGAVPAQRDTGLPHDQLEPV